MQKKTVNNKNFENKIPAKVITTPSASISSTGIPKKSFYSNSISYNCKYDKENSDFTTKPSQKRRHSPSYYDENFPESNDENTYASNNNNKILSQISPITPKRNCVNQYSATPPSSGSYQKWNRNNSMNKSSGGKG
jgi:hypothetical protein